MTAPFADLGPILVIIPTYNERENVERITARVRAAVPEAHILVADDNSPDGTGQLADDLAAADDQVHVLHRLGKEGLAAAYMAGFAWGLERGYQVLVEMDADGLALDLSLQDATGGYRVFRAQTLRDLDLHEVASQGYCFQVDMARRVQRSGKRVVEVPITFVEREYGTSKMSGNIVREALWRVTVWGAQERAEKARSYVAGRRRARSARKRGVAA